MKCEKCNQEATTGITWGYTHYELCEKCRKQALEIIKPIQLQISELQRQNEEMAEKIRVEEEIKVQEKIKAEENSEEVPVIPTSILDDIKTSKVLKDWING
jgi:replicative superfamily II helicase